MLASKPMDICDLAEAAARFSHRLERVKNQLSPDFEWYPYSTLEAFPILNSMLREERRNLLALAGSSPLLDIGCGDGAVSFFIESMGSAVKAIDHPATNYNRTLGFKALRTALGSSVVLELRDLDLGFDLRQHTYGLGICLGVLYHLKNPFGLLETLARHVRYCVLSTRIAQVTSGGTPITKDPVAYLVGSSETNQDSSNYWIFSETGLRRLLDRTGWDLCDYITTGCANGSDPYRADRDQRAYCAIRSKLPDPWVDLDLAGGWHALENGSWRWTERVFAVRLPGKPSGARLTFRFILPESILQALGPIRLTATMDGSRLPGSDYRTPGEHTYIQTIPSAALAGNETLVRFELDKAWHAPDTEDRRELGVQVAFWSYESKPPRALSPITLD
jgi:2-polyprenyl-3-methyl-5-hydroxy-6-metoxy-1,4-benzoquinol methylase